MGLGLADYKHILNESAVVAVTDAAGVILEVNDQFCKLSGYSREELIGKTHRVVNSGLHAPGFFKELWACISSGKVWRGEICNRAKDKSLYWLASTILPVLGADGKPECYVAVRIEITLRKQLEFEISERAKVEIELQIARQKAEAASAAKSEFLANMSHEIRTPLTAIIGGVELMTSAHENEERLRILSMIEANGAHLLRLIDDLLDLSKAEAGKLEVETSAVSLGKFFSELKSFFVGEVSRKNLKFNVEFESPIPHQVQVDATRLRQVLLNLIRNAIKFTSSGSITLSLNFSAEAGMGVLQCRVKDTGLGIGPQKQKLLFKPFVQGDAQTTRRFGGSGLGLALSLKLANLMGGSLDLESSTPDFGSVFRFTVPVKFSSESGFFSTLDSPEKSSNTSSRQSSGSALKGLRILLVEDSADNRYLVSKLLERAGASHVETAIDGPEGLAKARRGLFDVVLMDIQMPGLDGYEVSERLRAEGFKTPILALTAHTFQGDMDHCLASGMNGHIRKPIVPKDLYETIQLHTAPAKENDR